MDDDYDANKPEEAGSTAEDFLPKGYDVPSGAGNYMRFEPGENRFRILSSPIVGYEGWITLKDGGKKPVRKKIGESFSPDEIDDPEETKHFWAMPVWNYGMKRVQILEITQKGIQRTISTFAKDPEWGSPVGYDISVVRTGEGMGTSYEVIPSPPKLLNKEITDAFKKVNPNLEALFRGEDPFSESISPDDIDRALKEE